MLLPPRTDDTATLKLLEGNQILAVRNLTTGDSGSFEVVVQPPAVRVLVVTALANDGATSTAMRCTIRLARSVQVAQPSVTWANEQVQVAFGADAGIARAYLFVDGAYRGVADQSETKLPGSSLTAGRHSIGLVPVGKDGHTWPPTVTQITVAKRYDIQLSPALAQYVVPANEETSVAIAVTSRPECKIASTALVVAGRRLATIATNDWRGTVPLRPIPTGDASIELIGTTTDGRVLPAEIISINIKNDDYEQRLSFTPEYETIRSEASVAKDRDAEAASWLARAQAEPYWKDSDAMASEVYTAPNGAMFTTRAYAASRVVNPKLSEYLGRWAKAAAEAGQANLAVGRLWLKLDCRDRARAAFGRAIISAPANSATGAQARQAYEALIKATANTAPAGQ